MLIINIIKSKKNDRNNNLKRYDKILKEIIFCLESYDEFIENGENKTNYIF